MSWRKITETIQMKFREIFIRWKAWTSFLFNTATIIKILKQEHFQPFNLDGLKFLIWFIPIFINNIKFYILLLGINIRNIFSHNFSDIYPEQSLKFFLYHTNFENQKANLRNVEVEMKNILIKSVLIMLKFHFLSLGKRTSYSF